MNKFESALKNTLNNKVSFTANGAAAYATSGKALLDINFAVSTLRSKTSDEIKNMFSAAFYENPLIAIKWMFMLRDIRGSGMGERRTFRICLEWLAETRPDIVQRLVKFISDFGRWDDLFCLISMKEDDKVEDEVLGVIDEQWEADIKNMKNGKPISLLAKWMPSINTSSPTTVKLARFFCKELSLSEKQYRKTLSAMRKYLNVIEQKMSAQNWSEIDYETVPSKANLKYKDAFLKHDEVRRRSYLEKLDNGQAKINVGTLSVVDIVSKYMSYSNWSNRVKQTDATLEAAWKALPTTFDSTRNVIAVVDGSGSMFCGSTVIPANVANAIGIYFSERLNGPFKNKFITFSETPQYVDLSNCKSLHEKLSTALKYDECANTNVERTMKLILKTAIDNKLTQAEIPDLLILSDMQFDQGVSSYSHVTNLYLADKVALFENIKREFEQYGYKLPKITFWNICGRTNTIPLQTNECGVALISGFSQNICNMVMSNKLDPYEVLLDAVNSKRYDVIENAIASII